MKIKAIVEMPANSTFKYEQDKETGTLKLDRPLNQPVPYNYGFFPGTLEKDGDPLDVFVLTDTPIYPLTAAEVEIVGVIKGEDNGQEDNKILATLVGDYRGFYEMGTSVINRYLETYKEGFKITGFGGKEEAIAIYEEATKAFKDQ